MKTISGQCSFKLSTDRIMRTSRKGTNDFKVHENCPILNPIVAIPGGGLVLVMLFKQELQFKPNFNPIELLNADL